ncbi:MAG: ATP-dependent DNA helicase RecG [Acidobacteriota bacterium]|nr:ATP-dependent DNA helicase RecG [Acidobacteriota bacterium]
MSPRRLVDLHEIGVDQLRHVGPKRHQALARIGVATVFDLLVTYPRRYLDRTRRVDVADLAIGDEAAVWAQVVRVRARRTRQGRSLVEVGVADEGGSLDVVFFNQPWRERQLAVGTWAMFYAKVADYRGQRQMTNPVVDVAVGAPDEGRDPTRVGRVVALYPASARAGVTSWELGGLIEESLRRAGEFLDPLPLEVREGLGLVDRTASLWGIHLPADVADVEPARRRLAFDEFVRLQLVLALGRRHARAMARGVAHAVDPDDVAVGPGGLVDEGSSLLRQFLAGHPFALTGAQRRVLREIAEDLSADLPMHRLLQGDVGSGKTLVATAAIAVALGGHRQAAVMAPTEVLAEQHLNSLRRDFDGLEVDDGRVLAGRRPIQVEALTGRTRAPERRRILAGLADGSIDVVVGTHALLSDEVAFAALGIIVIDEQHRFGVEQRAVLREKGREHSSEGRDPDVLVMTATPIPRTAAMVIFGDLDRSVLDEMPEGREPIATSWLDDEDQCWRVVREEVAARHQAYVVCPLVEGSDAVEAASAVAEFERLAAGPLAGLRLGLLHGQMPGSDKDEVTRRFREGAVDVLVATVVIEVGVDVANATVMVIEDAWRFGLAQLHQLRGRVGRGAARGRCLLLGPAPSEDARARLEALVATTDGFEIAEIDLDQRGEGTLYGARQRGRSDLRLARLRDDEDLLVAAREVATRLSERLEDVPELVEEVRFFVGDDEADFLFKS